MGIVVTPLHSGHRVSGHRDMCQAQSPPPDLSSAPRVLQAAPNPAWIAPAPLLNSAVSGRRHEGQGLQPGAGGGSAQGWQEPRRCHHNRTPQPWPWSGGKGRGLTYPDGRVQVGHSHLLRSLHSLDHLLLVLWGEKSGAGQAPFFPWAPEELCTPGWGPRAHPPPETGTG